jgi:hypothetical protein
MTGFPALSGAKAAMELSYVLVTPYSIRKPRTGGIVSRENAKREMDIIRIAENNLSPLIQAHLS